MTHVRYGGAPRFALPAWAWVALPAAALTPVWTWSVARWQDKSDDPLGVVALLVLAMWVLHHRARFAAAPRAAGVWTSLALCAAAMLAPLPPLAQGVLAVLSVCAALAAVRSARQPMLAATGLALLALPLLSSLQFFAGYPLRVVTAEATRVVLALAGLAVERSGSALTVAGRLVIVDAPCSGIQMAWVAYFCACATAAWVALPDRRFLVRLPAVGAAVLVGNVVRNTVLVAAEASGAPWGPVAHEAIGAAVLSVVSVFVMWCMSRAVQRPGPAVPASAAPAARAVAGQWCAALVFSGFIAWHGLDGMGFAGAAQAAPRPSAEPAEWPVHWQGRVLRPLALSPLERRFAERFPGAIGRFADGEGVVLLRRVEQPTRMLHPASDCYRAVGYRIAETALEHQGESGLWRCFTASQDGRNWRVCEQIVDRSGQAYTDTSAWYWAAAMRRTQGPWLAVTRARPL